MLEAPAKPRTQDEPPFFSLVPQETNPQEPSPPTWGTCQAEAPDVSWRHRRWQKQRSATAAALEATGAPLERLARFASCGSHAWVYRSNNRPGVFKVTADFCHDRFCLPCAGRRARETAALLREALPTAPTLFVTLTLRPGELSLIQLVNKLQASFSALRRRPVWRDNVAGGASFIEIKRSVNNLSWNVHLHALAESSWIPHQALRDEWKRLTSDSFIVDIRRVESPNDLARYVTKYVSKGICPSAYGSHDHLVDAITALAGRRLCATFGKWRGMPLSYKAAKRAMIQTPQADLPGLTPERSDPRAASYSGERQTTATTIGSGSIRETHAMAATPAHDAHPIEARHADDDEWTAVGPLNQIISRASLGDEDAKSILRCLDDGKSFERRGKWQKTSSIPSLFPAGMSLQAQCFADRGMHRRSTLHFPGSS
jgi:hypothetical protein